jgi:dolichol kinase
MFLTRSQRLATGSLLALWLWSGLTVLVVLFEGPGVLLLAIWMALGICVGVAILGHRVARRGS